MPKLNLNRVEMPRQDPIERGQNFDEVALGYSEEQAIEEASRRDMGVLIISPNDKGGMLYKDKGDSINAVDCLNKAKEIFGNLGAADLVAAGQ